MSADRHEKSVRFEPGHVIPAGQPYRIEFKWPDHAAHERTHHFDVEVDTNHDWFVDSSWRPPLNLPTEPTWGILVHSKDLRNGHVTVGNFHLSEIGYFGGKSATGVLDFIPLTDEQVNRIESAR